MKKPLRLKTIVDILLSPLTFLSAILLSNIRKIGLHKMPVSRGIFRLVGVLPVRDHYYEPLFNPRHLRNPLSEDRNLPGIDMNAREQLEILGEFDFNDELLAIPAEKKGDLEFYYHNLNFQPGDAEYLYKMVRFFKPGKIVEIGCGHSTLMISEALRQNRKADGGYACEHICIEPYEIPWLEKLDVKLIREKVELVDKHVFRELNQNDILFIDSSHVIKPQGDVLFEQFEILPGLRSGVLVHIHDIFTPRDYLDKWVLDEVKLWNEQYLLEALLMFNNEFKIIGALNYLKHNFWDEISAKCPILQREPYREPCSFWIVKK